MHNQILDSLNNVSPLIKGVGSITAMQVIESVPTDSNFSEIIKLIIQLGIGLVTLINLIRNSKDKPKKNDNQGGI